MENSLSMTEQGNLRALSRRWIESFAAAVILVVVLPVVIGAAVVSAVTFRAWPFFTHERVGWKQRKISVTKIRTLPVSTATHIDKYQLRSVEVPVTMQRLRKLHIDELPQLVAVITGKMGFVGPRPEMNTLHDEFSPAFALERTSVRPGLTGMWQVSDGVVRLIGETPEYDKFYVSNRTARLDLWILYRTVVKVFFGRTVALAGVPDWTLRRLPRSQTSVAASTSSTGN